MKALKEERDVSELEESNRRGGRDATWKAATPTSYCTGPGREEGKGKS